MSTKRVFDCLKLVAVAGWLLLLAGCSTVLYKANGQYTDDLENSRRILMQWEAQKYYIPFVDAKVDYGSVSLQAECLQDVLLDHRDDQEHGFIFVERPQSFKVATGAPDIRVGNFLVCAKFEGNRSIEEISSAGDAQLLVLCESKSDVPFLPPSLEGYSLNIARGETEETLLCRMAD